MLLRRVSREKIPRRSSDQAEESTRPKRPAPAVMHHNVRDQAWGDAGTHTDAGKYDAIGDSAFLRGNPSRDELIGGGKHDGFSGPEEKAHRRQVKNGECDFRGDGRGQRGENSPPQNSHSEHAAGSRAIGEPAPKRLEKSVAHQESASERS